MQRECLTFEGASLRTLKKTEGGKKNTEGQTALEDKGGRLGVGHSGFKDTYHYCAKIHRERWRMTAF